MDEPPPGWRGGKVLRQVFSMGVEGESACRNREPEEGRVGHLKSKSTTSVSTMQFFRD